MIESLLLVFVIETAVHPAPPFKDHDFSYAGGLAMTAVTTMTGARGLHAT